MTPRSLLELLLPPLSFVSSLTTLAEFQLSLRSWWHAKNDATVREYIDWLRRKEQTQLLRELRDNREALQEVGTIIRALSDATDSQAKGLLDELSLIKVGIFTLHQQLNENDARYEQEYLDQVYSRYSRLRTFGTADLREVKQPLDLAYVSLAMSTTSDGSGRYDAAPTLRQNPRMTIQGAAGSGKSTLLSWLAMKCADRRDLNNPWRNGIPFFIRLRSLVEQGVTPSVSLFTRHTIDPAVWDKTPPESWLYDVLDAGRAVVLIDGVDEISTVQRRAFWEWVGQFCDSYPNCRVYITSRHIPSEAGGGISANWNPPAHFAASHLLDMTTTDRTLFIEKWHDSLLAIEGDPEIRRELTEAQAGLPDKLGDPLNQRVRDLCRNPLLCAMVCTLHWRHKGYLPTERVDLYDRCCRMLLEERNRQRDIGPIAEEMSEFSLGDGEVVLQRLAWHMVQNKDGSGDQQIEISQEEASRWIQKALPLCRSTKTQGVAASVVLEHLILRTGLLREPSRGLVDFPHRTFQEYLAACGAQGQRALWAGEAGWMAGAFVFCLLQAREWCGSMRLPSQ
ncbi:NACHT domain-containing protein [bacterium]|nr:NACHT domain-containing protein [bacterium]